MFETLDDQEWIQVDRAWDLLDEGDAPGARAVVDLLLQRRPRHPDLLVLAAAIATDEGRPKLALSALQGAEQSADPALFFHMRGLAHYQLSEMQAAQRDAEKALAIRPHLAESHALLGKIHEFLGSEERALLHGTTATELDPDAFPAALEVGDEEFDKLVEKSLAELPARVRDHLREIPVLVEPLPDLEILSAEEPPLSPDILGLFVGRDLMARRHDDVPSSPGAIYLFRRNLLRFCRDREELTREVRITVQHEVGHFLGLDEDELERWGLA